MPGHVPADHLAWRRVEVDGRRVHYGVAGHGLPVLFVHGWALGSHAYKRACKRLVRMGCRVYAPSLPDFGGSAALPAGRRNLDGYAEWAAAYLDAVGVDEPVLAVGHSFGGAVVTRLAHDHPDRVGHLVLINAVGAGVWSARADAVRRLAERPLWSWALDFSRDTFSGRGSLRAVTAIAEDALPNLLANPAGLWRVAGLARRADLTAELRRMRTLGMPVALLWGEGDMVIPRASFDAFCRELGVVGRLVPGRHSWLLGDPDGFAAVMAPVVRAAAANRAARAGLVGPRWGADAELGRVASG